MYSYLLIILLLVVGLYFTFRTKFIQVRLLKESIRVVACVLILVGALLDFGLVWNLADVLMGVMAIINLPVIVILGKKATVALKDYCKQRKEGKDPVFKASTVDLAGKTDFWN